MTSHWLPTLLLALTVLLSGASFASGFDDHFDVKKGVERAGFILVVEKRAPATAQLTQAVDYTDKKGAKHTFSSQLSVLQLKVTRVLKQQDAELATPVAVGDSISVASVSDVANRSSRLAELKTGMDEGPIYPMLDGEARPESATTFLLLASWSADLKTFVGVGGYGLLPMSQEAAVAKLLEPKVKK